MENYFYCYSGKLKNYLRDNGMRYDICALNPNSKKTFWRYERTDELTRLLDKWFNREV